MMGSVSFTCIFILGFLVSSVHNVDPAVKRYCPPGALDIVGDHYFGVYKGTCFLFITYVRVTYHSALRTCGQHNGTLAMPKTKSINDFLVNKMHRMDERDAMWIGMHDQATEGEMVWEDGDTVEWDNFDWGVHGLWGGREDCIALDPDDGEWHDYTCDRPWISGITTSHLKPFICQYVLY